VRIAIIHGPNLNLLGNREPEIYGSDSLDDINAELSALANENGVKLTTFQSNSEGDIVDHLQVIGPQSDGILINPAAFTHTSVAIRDALAAIATPTVEIHLSNPDAREPFRHRSLIADIVIARIAGFGTNSYRFGLLGLIEHIMSRTQS
jgi:3-dehydroquinate dehydratase-2